MPQLVRQKNSTDQTVLVRAYVASTGLPKTGLVYNTASLVCYYRRGPTGTVTQLTLATQTNGGAHADGGFVEVSTNMPGVYRLDLSDAVVATGADWVQIILSGVADTVFEPITIDLITGDPYGATVDANVTQISGDSTAADNLEAALDGTGGVTLSATLGANAIAATSIATGAITNAKFAAGAIDAAAIAADAITAAKIAADAIGASELAADAAAEIADKILGRSIAGGSDGGRTVTQALRAVRNRVAISGGTMTVYQEDDSTSSWTAAVTTTAGNPISQIDPA